MTVAFNPLSATQRIAYEVIGAKNKVAIVYGSTGPSGFSFEVRRGAPAACQSFRAGVRRCCARLQQSQTLQRA